MQSQRPVMHRRSICSLPGTIDIGTAMVLTAPPAVTTAGAEAGIVASAGVEASRPAVTTAVAITAPASLCRILIRGPLLFLLSVPPQSNR